MEVTGAESPPPHQDTGLNQVVLFGKAGLEHLWEPQRLQG